MKNPDEIVSKIIRLLNDGSYDYDTDSTCECPFDSAKCGAYAYTDHTLTVGGLTFTRTDDSNHNTGSWSIPRKISDASNLNELVEALDEIFEPTDWDYYWETLDYSEWEEEDEEEEEEDEWADDDEE